MQCMQHCKNGIVNVTTKQSDVHYFQNHYMVVIIKLSDAHYNNSERHYLEPRVQCSDDLYVVIITNKCSDNHHFNVVNNFHCISYSDHH